MKLENNNRKEILLIVVQNNLSIVGFRYIHYSLLENGWQSKLLFLPYLNFNNSLAMRALQEFILKINPLFIGLSLTSLEYYRARDLSKYLKDNFSTIPIVWGGVHPTIDPESCFPFADFVCIGEGEKTILDLAEEFSIGGDPRKIKNLSYLENGLLIRNPLYPLNDNLDIISSFDHIPQNSFIQRTDNNIYLIDKQVFRKEARYQGKIYEILTSRGCAFSCTYCCNNFYAKLYANNRIRRRSVDNIIAELQSAVKNAPEIVMISVQDDSFLSCNNEYLREFCQAYKTKINKPFAINTIPTYVNRNKLGLLKEAGLSWINMGLQSGSDRVNKEIYKRRSLKNDFLLSANLIHELKLAGKYDVILDNPFESESEIIETIETLIETPKPYAIEFYSLIFYPGTELHERAIAECPEQMENSLEKSYLAYKKTTLNRLSTLSVFLPKVIMTKLLQLYRKDSGRGAIFKMALFISVILSSVYFKPKVLLNTLKYSHQNSYYKALLSIPLYLKEILVMKKMYRAGSKQ